MIHKCCIVYPCAKYRLSAQLKFKYHWKNVDLIPSEGLCITTISRFNNIKKQIPKKRDVPALTYIEAEYISKNQSCITLTENVAHRWWRIRTKHPLANISCKLWGREHCNMDILLSCLVPERHAEKDCSRPKNIH